MQRTIRPDELSASQPLYRLGRISFVVKSADAGFQNELARLLPACRVAPEVIYEIESDGNFRQLVGEILGLQSEYLWLSAACVVSPAGHKVLISGNSSAGKSTTVLALALRYGWKVLAEDLTCIDLHTGRIISFATPFSLKKGTVELLQETISMVPEPVALGEWVPQSDLHAHGEYGSNLDLSLYFGTARHGEPMQVSVCSPGEYVRLLLPCSNLIHCAHGPDKLAEYVSSGTCYRVSGGSLSERLNLILELTHRSRSMDTSEIGGAADVG